MYNLCFTLCHYCKVMYAELQLANTADNTQMLAIYYIVKTDFSTYIIIVW